MEIGSPKTVVMIVSRAGWRPMNACAAAGGAHPVTHHNILHYVDPANPTGPGRGESRDMYPHGAGCRLGAAPRGEQAALTAEGRPRI